MQTHVASRAILLVASVLGGLSGPAGAQVTSAQASPLQYVPLQTPCRAVDTRQSGGPLAAGTSRTFNPGGGACNLPGLNTTSVAYAVNITAVPAGTLDFLSVWPAGQDRPTVSTLNSLDGRVKANAAIVAGGASGYISVFASNQTDVIVDVNGYFIAQTLFPPTYTYFPLAPCRLVDTRAPDAKGFGAPSLAAGQQRTFAMALSPCNLPGDPQTYGGALSLNVTAIPKSGQPLHYLTIWATPQGGPGTPPTTSLLNATTGTITANAAIVTVNIATYSSVSVYASDDADVIIDLNGYFSFSQAHAGGLSLYTLTPCRVLDTRASGGAFKGKLVVPVASGIDCDVPIEAQGVVFNTTVVPPQPLPYLTLWPDGATQPVVSTLNATDGQVTSNMAIVGMTNGSVDAFAIAPTQLILDTSGFFAP